VYEGGAVLVERRTQDASSHSIRSSLSLSLPSPSLLTALQRALLLAIQQIQREKCTTTWNLLPSYSLTKLSIHVQPPIAALLPAINSLPGLRADSLITK